jgi:hypothetical protein
MRSAVAQGLEFVGGGGGGAAGGAPPPPPPPRLFHTTNSKGERYSREQAIVQEIRRILIKNIHLRPTDRPDQSPALS